VVCLAEGGFRGLALFCLLCRRRMDTVCVVSALPSDRVRRRLLPLFGGFSLPALVSLAALFEFVFYRLLQPLLRGQKVPLPALFVHGVLTLGTFSAHFAAVLSLCSFAALLYVWMGTRGIVTHPMGRVGLGLLGVFFLLLATAEMFLPSFIAQTIGLVRAQWLLQVSSVCLSFLLIFSVFPCRTEKTLHKLSLLLLFVPPVLFLESQWHLFREHSFLQRASFALLIPGYGATVAAGCLGGYALLLLLHRQWFWQKDSAAMLATSVLVGGLTFILVKAPTLALRLIYLGFDLQLPQVPWLQAVFILSLSAWSLAVFSHVLRKGRLRLRGLGLLLVGLAGAQPKMLHQELFYLVGLLCLVESLALSPNPAPDTELGPASGPASGLGGAA